MEKAHDKAPLGHEHMEYNSSKSRDANSNTSRKAKEPGDMINQNDPNWYETWLWT